MVKLATNTVVVDVEAMGGNPQAQEFGLCYVGGVAVVHEAGGHHSWQKDSCHRTVCHSGLLHLAVAGQVLIPYAGYGEILSVHVPVPETELGAAEFAGPGHLLLPAAGVLFHSSPDQQTGFPVGDVLLLLKLHTLLSLSPPSFHVCKFLRLSS